MRRQVIIADKGFGEENGILLWFGACGPTYVYSRLASLEDALEAAAGRLSEVAPGHFDPPEYEPCDEHGAALEPDECKACSAAVEEAEADLTYTESGWIPSWEWGIVSEHMSPRELLAFYRGE